MEHNGDLQVRVPPAIRFVLRAACLLLIATNLLMVAAQVVLILSGSDAVDWHTYREAVERFADGQLYEQAEWWYGWRYSPVAVFPFALITPLGETVWRAMHIAGLLGLPGRLRLLALASYPFWFDVHAGNVLIFVAICAYWALRGNRWGIGIFLALTLLIPRPLMLPLAAWLLWKRPEWRAPFAAVFVVHAGAVIATGYAIPWFDRLLMVGGEEIALNINAAPSAFIGPWWLLAAIPLAIWLFRNGYPATAGLMIQPYWLPYYLLIPLADRSSAVTRELFRIVTFRGEHARTAAPALAARGVALRAAGRD